MSGLLTGVAAPARQRWSGKIFAFIVQNTPKMQKLNYAILAALFVSLSSCEAIGDIFKAGVWSGLIIVALVIIIVIWLISKFRK